MKTPITNGDASSSRIRTAAWLLTILWVDVFLLFILGKGGVHAVATLQLNAFGDLAAGLAAPLAFIWLVAGYYLQQVELRQNTDALLQQDKALRQQVDELSRSVEQQATVAKATMGQLELAQRTARVQVRQLQFAMQPVLSARIGLKGDDLYDNGNFQFEIELTNHGHMLLDGGLWARTKNVTLNTNQLFVPILAFAKSQTRKYLVSVPRAFGDDLVLDLMYTDGLGEKRLSKVHASVPLNRNSIMVSVENWRPPD